MWRKGSVDEFLADTEERIAEDWAIEQSHERACNRGLGCLIALTVSCLFWGLIALVIWRLM